MNPALTTNLTESPSLRRQGAFTLLELLVVVGIIGVLATVTIPSLKGLGRSNRTAASNRQILDDLHAARSRAINERTTVYMVFLPPTLHQLDLSRYSVVDQREIGRLLPSQMTAYALIAKRSVGDQPGQDTPRYLTDWRPLPDGMILPVDKFVALAGNEWAGLASTNRPFAYYTGLPFPNVNSRTDYPLPGIAFNSQGQLVSPGGLEALDRDEVITLAEGSIFVPRDAKGAAVRAPLDIVETPKGNREVVRINWLTGRAEVIRPPMP